MPATLRIATRGSQLALWQARFVRDQLQQRHPDLTIELVEVVSTGDKIRDRPLAAVGGTGLFTKEVQQVVLAGDADLAVHSLKDLPTKPTPGLILAAVPPRAPAGDALLAPVHQTFAQLPTNAVVATSSPRRKAQVLRHRPDLVIVDIRGNVETRVRKLHEEGLDGLILAQAGLDRLGLSHVITECLSESILLPAVGQGALGIECRSDDQHVQTLLQEIHHVATGQCVTAERSLMRRLEGGCQAPIGAFASIEQQTLTLRAIVLAPDGEQSLADSMSGPSDQADQLGEQLADRLLQRGAQPLIAQGRFP